MNTGKKVYKSYCKLRYISIIWVLSHQQVMKNVEGNNLANRFRHDINLHNLINFCESKTSLQKWALTSYGLLWKNYKISLWRF